MLSCLKTIINPSSSDALEFIDRYHKSKPEKTMILLIGNCMVDYRGRAQSLLDWGERVMMIKQDGTVLVHRPVMREPVNWQPSGTKTEFRVEENHLVIRSHHTRPTEKMKVTFGNLKLAVATSLCDNANLAIAGMEADVVNQIISDPDVIEEGLRISKREKHVKSGLIDLFGYDKDHVRAELMFNKGYLQRQFKRKYIDNYGNVKVSSSRNINKISRPVLKFSKSFFKKIDLPSVFHSVISGNSHFVVLNQMNDLHDFYLRVNPEMISVIDSVLNHVPLVEHDAIMFLRKHPNMRRQFVRVYDGNGNWFYNWDPVKAEYLRNDMIKNRYAKPRVPNVTIPNYMK